MECMPIAVQRLHELSTRNGARLRTKQPAVAVVRGKRKHRSGGSSFSVSQKRVPFGGDNVKVWTLGTTFFCIVRQALKIRVKKVA